jgi:hypothetical protein
MSDKKKGFDLAIALKRQRDVGQLGKELWKGIEKDIIPHHYIGAAGLGIAIWFWCWHGYFVRVMPIFSKCFILFIVFGGYLVWALHRVMLLKKFLANLTETFENAGLRTISGRLPSFISDRAIDNDCRVMMVNSNKVPYSTFLSAKEKLEAGFFGYIDKIEDSRVSGVIKLYYSEDDFPQVIDLDSPYGKPSLSFVIGNTRSGVKMVNLFDVPHFLVAGSSNSGKSTFIKQVIATLYLNNADADFVLIDLKFGLESIEFRDLPRIVVHKTNQEALQALVAIQDELKERGALLYSFDCKDITEYNKKSTANDGAEKRPAETLRRKIIIIDEAAQIFLSGPDMTASDVAKARGVVSTIAAQGRAVGVNVIISTQRPDVNIIDGSIKANLQGRVCFHMSDNATSMTILDSVRAADLPDIPGRAIFRNGPELLELQVPQLSDKRLQEIFKPLRVLPPPKSEKKENEPSNAKADTNEILKRGD